MAQKSQNRTLASLLLGVLSALILLTVMTVGVTMVDLGSQWNFVVAMIIATIKEKVPGTADARVGPFLAGLAGFAAPLLLAEGLAP